MNIFKMLKKAIRPIIKIKLYMLILLGVAFVSLKAPEMHNHWLRDKVGQKVYTIRDSIKSGGGTGFAVRAPSGTSYIITNDHVCNISKDGQTVLVISENGDMIRRNIIAHDGYSDLCLIQGLDDVKGLTIANDVPSKGDKMYIIGHPHLLPLTVSSGEMIGLEDVTMNMGPISMFNPQTQLWEQLDIAKGAVVESDCMAPKNTIHESVIDMVIIKLYMKQCLVTVKDAYITTITVLGGNSGSPMVNFFGQVNGVVFSTDEASWGRIVSLYDLNSFLKNY